MAQKSPVDTIGRAEAKALTERIRKHIDAAWQDITLAYEGKAWKAMGYASWEAYVKAEFDMGRSRSYQLLDQGRVIRALAAATGEVSTSVDISEAAARDIKPELPAVTAEIKQRVERGEDPETAVSATVAAARTEKERQREERKAHQAEIDRQRDETRESLPQAIKDIEAAKQKAIADRKASKDATPLYNGLPAEDRISELEESVRVLEAEADLLRAENKLYSEMKVQFAQGGFDKVIAGKDAEISALETRLYRESEDKASWMKSARYWQAEAKKLGWSNGDFTIDLETGEIADA